MQTQYFLPVMTPDRIILGTLAITPTLFTGSETTVSIGGVSYPTQKLSFPAVLQGQESVEYLVISATQTEARTVYANLGTLLPGMLYRVEFPVWPLSPSVYVHEGDLDLLMRGRGRSAAVAPVVPPALTPGNVTVNRFVNSPFSNAPNCEFFDLSWPAITGLTVEQLGQVVSASVGSPTADPGSTNSLRAYLVRAPGSLRPFETNSTVRIVRVTKDQVATGTYTWPITLVDKNNRTSTFNLSLVAE